MIEILIEEQKKYKELSSVLTHSAKTSAILQ